MADDEDLDMEKEMAAAMAADTTGGGDAAKTAAEDMEREMAAAMAADTAGGGDAAKTAAEDMEKEMAAAMAADTAGGGAATTTAADDIEKEMAAAMAADAATSAESAADDIEKEMAAAMAADVTNAAGDASPKTDDIEALLDQATDSLNQATGDKPAPAGSPSPFSLQDLPAGVEDGESQSMDLLGEVELELRIELGKTVMRLEDVLKLRSGSVVALDKLSGDPVDVFVNGRLIARGEVMVMNDNFCIRVTELVGA